MGQYYTPIIIRGNSKSSYNSWDYDNGLKLTEHSYLGNNFVETVLKQLFESKGRLAWVGDYAEPEDVKSPLAEKFIEVERNSKKYEKTPDKEKGNSFYLYFINHTKKEYINMKRYITCNKVLDKYEMVAHPIPLLTAIGNGRGGGDYWGSCMNKIGYWACDEIESTYEKPEGYKDITAEIRFVEGEEDN